MVNRTPAIRLPANAQIAIREIRKTRRPAQTKRGSYSFVRLGAGEPREFPIDGWITNQLSQRKVTRRGIFLGSGRPQKH